MRNTWLADAARANLKLTSTFGVRQTTVDRYALDHGWTEGTVDGRSVAVKIGHRDGVILHAIPSSKTPAGR